MENLLKCEREKKGVSREELAKLAGCDVQMITDIEMMRIIPSVKLMQGLAFALQVSPDQIFNVSL